MADLAWACRITRQNQAVIRSEHPKFDQVEFAQWLANQGTGYFIRDPSSPFDCKYMADEVFHQIYRFLPGDASALFRRIEAIRNPG